MYISPFVASPTAVVRRLLTLANLKPGEVLFDLGAGDGRPVIMAAQEFGAKAVGVELRQDLAKQALKMIYDLVQASAGVKLILAHWGGGLFFYNLLKREVPDSLTDVYFDTAASPFLYKPEIYRLAGNIMGPRKILFGSDYPLIPPSRYFRERGCATSVWKKPDSKNSFT